MSSGLRAGLYEGCMDDIKDDININDIMYIIIIYHIINKKIVNYFLYISFFPIILHLFLNVQDQLFVLLVDLTANCVNFLPFLHCDWSICNL